MRSATRTRGRRGRGRGLDDLARWAAAGFGDALLSPRMRAARLRRVSLGHLLRGSAYGLGLQVEQGWHFHVGELFGWETLAMASARTGRVVVVRNACCGSPFENYLVAREAMPALAAVGIPCITVRRDVTELVARALDSRRASLGGTDVVWTGARRSLPRDRR